MTDQAWSIRGFIVFFIVLFEISCLNHQKLNDYFITLIFFPLFFVLSQGAFVLERLSILHISAVQRLTGASILSTFDTDTPESSVGQLGKIEHVVLNDKRSVEILVICSYPTENKLLHARLVTLSLW